MGSYPLPCLQREGPEDAQVKQASVATQAHVEERDQHRRLSNAPQHKPGKAKTGALSNRAKFHVTLGRNIIMGELKRVSEKEHPEGGFGSTGFPVGFPFGVAHHRLHEAYSAEILSTAATPYNVQDVSIVRRTATPTAIPPCNKRTININISTVVILLVILPVAATMHPKRSPRRGAIKIRRFGNKGRHVMWHCVCESHFNRQPTKT